MAPIAARPSILMVKRDIYSTISRSPSGEYRHTKNDPRSQFSTAEEGLTDDG